MNKSNWMFTPLFAVGLLALSPAARADEWNQKTTFTFSRPVEIPGQVLPAGTYVFKLVDSLSNRHIVRVFADDEQKVLGTFLTIPEYRHEVSDKTIITFSERPGGEADAIRTWIYPGRNYGHEFVYPKKEAVALARANHVPVPAMPEELAAHTTVHTMNLEAPEIVAIVLAPLKAEEPSGVEVELEKDFPAAEPSAVSLPETLPATASQMPLIGFAGLLALGAAVTLRRVAVALR
jgi:hypothetical protein